MNIKHVLASQQFKDKTALLDLFKTADEMEMACRQGSCPHPLKGKVMASLHKAPTSFFFRAGQGVFQYVHVRGVVFLRGGRKRGKGKT